MKNELLQNRVALHMMVSRISAGSLPSATRKRSLIINDVPHDLQANTDEHMVATVFGSLLNAIITHTENSCIRVSAKLYGRVVLLNLKENQHLNSSVFVGNLRQVQQLAEKMGGTVSISNHYGKPTTIVFSFLNNLPATA